MSCEVSDAPGATGSAAQEWTGHRQESREYRRILVGLLAAGVATFAQLYSPQALLPTIAADLAVAPSQAALSVSMATYGVALAVLGWSWVADRVGRLTAMKAAIGLTAVVGIAVSLAPNFEVLLALRVLEGMCVAGLPALAMAYLHEEIDAEHAAAAAGAYIAGTSIGGMAGRLLAGALAEPFGWRGAMVGVALSCAAAALVFFLLMPPARGYEARPVGLGDVARGVRACLGNPRLLALYVTAFLAVGSLVGVYNYLGFRLEGPEFGLSPTLASFVFVAYLAGTVGSKLTGRWVPRYGRRAVLVGCLLAMLAGLGLTLAGQLAIVVAGMLLFSAGFFAAHAIASGWAGADGGEARAQSTALYTVFFYVGSGLLGWAVGLGWAGFGWPGVTASVAALLVAALAVVVLVLRRPASV